MNRSRQINAKMWAKTIWKKWNQQRPWLGLFHHKSWRGSRSRTLNICRFIVSFIFSKAFISASAYCSSIGTNSSTIFSFSICSQIKWNLVSIYLLCPWNTRFFIKVMTDLLSTNNFIAFNSCFVSFLNKLLSHNTWHTTTAATINLAHMITKPLFSISGNYMTHESNWY